MRFHDSRYTGANRCWPCTALNSAVLVVAVGALAAAGQFGTALALAVGGALAIGFRGYLVPGTPRLGRRLPRPVRERFGEVDPAASLPATAALVEAGVLTEGLDLTDDAAAAIETRAKELLTDRSALETAVESQFPDVVEVSVNRALDGGERWFALDADEVTVRQWDARPVAALDVAAASHLADAPVDWAGRTATEREHLLALVRYGAPTCPACDEPYTDPDGPTVACCGGRTLVGERRCDACGYPLVDRNDLPAADPAETLDGVDGRTSRAPGGEP